jgi:hypothetical protein
MESTSTCVRPRVLRGFVMSKFFITFPRPRKGIQGG